MRQRYKILNLLLFFCFLISVSLLAYQIYDYRRMQVRISKNIRNKANELISDITEKLNAKFLARMELNAEITAHMNRGKYSEKQVKSYMNQIMENHKDVYGLAIAFKPGKYKKHKKLFSPYFNRREEGLVSVQIEDLYDYTKSDTSGFNWYVTPLNNGEMWVDPYYGSASDSIITVHSKPFEYNKSGEIDGVSAIVYSMKDIDQIMKSLNLNGYGYPIILTQEGNYIFHPNQEKVLERDNILLELNTDKNPELKMIIRGALSGKSLSYRPENESWMFLNPILSTGWTLGIIFSQEFINRDLYILRQKLIYITIFILLAAFFLSIRIFRLFPGTIRYWGISSISTLALIGCIIFIWGTEYRFPVKHHKENIIITDHSNLSNLINEEEEKALGNHSQPPVTIPTGVFIQSLEFSNSNNINLTGYVWQKYPADIDRIDEHGVIFPESINSSMTLTYNRTIGGENIKGWYFRATFRQTFDYYKFPFDRKEVRLRMWHREFDKNIILIPDFSAYDIIIPDYLPGIEKDIVLSGWDMKESYFSYYFNSYNSNFGISNYSGTDRFPELYYSVLIERKFINPFISNLLPFFVMSFILFGIFLLLDKEEKKYFGFKFDMIKILASCSGLFFTVLIAHQKLRDSLISVSIVYLEFFYFIMYGSLLFVIVDAFFISFHANKKFLDSHFILLQKVLYWPVLLLFLYYVTYRTFY